jgi:hypothetical protein
MYVPRTKVANGSIPNGDHQGAKDATDAVVIILNPRISTNCGHGVFPKPVGRVQYS